MRLTLRTNVSENIFILKTAILFSFFKLTMIFYEFCCNAFSAASFSLSVTMPTSEYTPILCLRSLADLTELTIITAPKDTDCQREQYRKHG